MMDGRLFDTLEAVARKVRGSNAPFGGIQASGGRRRCGHELGLGLAFLLVQWV
jgi:hypothetical protein